MKQFFQIIRGVLYALVLFELLTLLGGVSESIANFLSAHSTATAVALLLLCLFLTWIRRACGNHTEYLVTMQPGAYGRIGSVFDKEKFDYPERLFGGFLSGVHTYRAQNGSLLFTVHQPGTGNPWLRLSGTIILIIVLLVPLSGVSAINTVNQTFSEWVGKISDSALESKSEPEQQPEPEPETTPTGDSVSQTLSDFQAWLSSLFDTGTYILPSDKRLLTNADIEDMDAAQIQRAINEIYARHHCPLQSSADSEYFESQKWYKPDPDMTQARAWEQFSEIEQKNVEFLAARRDQLKS